MPHPEPDIDLDNLMAKIRVEVSRRRGQQHAYSGDSAPPLVALHRARLLLDQARRVANVGTTVPPFGVFGPVRRWLAQAVTRVLYYVLQVVTVDQRVFNGLVVNALSSIADELQRSESTSSTRLRDLEAQLAAIEAERDHVLADLRTNLALQERRLARLLETFASGVSHAEQADAVSDEQKHLLDGLYVSLEERFRGTRDDIKDRLRIYLPKIRQAGAGSSEKPTLDVACGRGEWLELLREEGLDARGIEQNQSLVRTCREAGFEIIEDDALAALRALPDRSFGAVTAFHLIEHLPYARLVELLDETLRVLQPGGIAIFETPNPDNLLVGTSAFYLDPTHQRPLPSALARFLAEARGFGRVEIMPLHPFPPSTHLQGSEAAERLNEVLYGPRDYAVFGWKS